MFFSKSAICCLLLFVALTGYFACFTDARPAEIVNTPVERDEIEDAHEEAPVGDKVGKVEMRRAPGCFCFYVNVRKCNGNFCWYVRVRKCHGCRSKRSVEEVTDRTDKVPEMSSTEHDVKTPQESQDEVQPESDNKKVEMRRAPGCFCYYVNVRKCNGNFCWYVRVRKCHGCRSKRSVEEVTGRTDKVPEMSSTEHDVKTTEPVDVEAPQKSQDEVQSESDNKKVEMRRAPGCFCYYVNVRKCNGNFCWYVRVRKCHGNC